MFLKTFHISRQGAGHIEILKECQDASESYQDSEMAIAVVCDGHGGADYVRSARGSKFAAKIVKDQIKEFVQNLDEKKLERHYEMMLSDLCASIISSWRTEVEQDLEAEPLTESELETLSDKAREKYQNNIRTEIFYGTTVLAAACTENYWFGIQIGDGKCVSVSYEGTFFQPIPWDEKCFLNKTTSICDSMALYNFRSFYTKEIPAAVFIGSDGVDDCFQNDEQLQKLYSTILCSFAEKEDVEQAIEELSEYLPILSEKGSRDDISIAAILDMDKIKEIPQVASYLEAKIEKEKISEEDSVKEEELKEWFPEEEVQEEKKDSWFKSIKDKMHLR